MEVIHPSMWNGWSEGVAPDLRTRKQTAPFPSRIMIPELNSVRLLLLPEINCRSHSWGVQSIPAKALSLRVVAPMLEPAVVPKLTDDGK